MEYQYTPGYRERKVSAKIAAAELDRIKQEKGALTAPSVFEAAKPDDAALHPEFIWDGEMAVRELGLIRARSLIRAVQIRPAEGSDEPERRVWVHVAPEKGRSDEKAGEYVYIEDAVQHIDIFERALTELQRKVDAASEALNELKRAAEGTSDERQKAVVALAVQGFGAVREALAILR